MLSKQLQDQIEQEGSERAEGWQDKMKSQIAKTEYESGAEKYAEKWQEAQQLVERYEKALKDFANRLNEVCGQNGIITSGIHFIIDDMLMFPLAPKTGSDETKGASDR